MKLNRMILLVLTALPFIGRATVHAGGQRASCSAPTVGDISTVTRFYHSSAEQLGIFPGTLVCVQCDHSIGNRETCERNGHVYGLRTNDGSTLQLLLTNSDEAFEHMDAEHLLGKKIQVHGKHYRSMGAILVSAIRPVE